jgi:hypothetical protein
MIYFILAKGAHSEKEDKLTVKIGRSFNPKGRVGELQTGNHCVLELIESVNCKDSVKLEKIMHKTCEKNKVHGEWFEFTKKELDMYLDLAKKEESINSEEDTEKMQYCCTCCDYSSNLESNLKRHNKSGGHMDNAKAAKLSFCEFCGLVCNNKFKKMRHKKICQDNPENLKNVTKSNKKSESDIKMIVKLCQQQMEMTNAMLKEMTKNK